MNLRGQPTQPAFLEAVRETTGLDLPLVPNTVARNDTLSALWLGPNEWLLLSAADYEHTLADGLRRAFGNLFAAVTDVTSGYASIRVRGHESRHLLARGCTLDLHPRAFGPGNCAQTQLAGTDAVIRAIAGEMPVFEVLVRRSLAVYLWRWLDDAARDVGFAARGGATAGV